jgi:PAS domain S-box-containing protein
VPVRLGSNRICLAAFVCWGLHVLVILVLPLNTTRIFLSDTIQCLIGIFAVLASIQAARRSSTFGRTFWNLATTGFALLTLGLALSIYVDSFHTTLGSHAWIIDVFVNAWTAPLVMCLFLDPYSENEGRDWRQVFDFTQVAIVFVLLYAYSSIVSSVGFAPRRLALASDTLIAAGFFLRGFTLPTGSARPLFVRFGYFRSVSALTQLILVLGVPEPVSGDAFDLIWSITLLIPIIIAASWTGSREPVAARTSYVRTSRLLTTQFMPLIFPLLIIILASQLVGRRLMIAATAVLISVALTYGRLLVTQREQERSSEALLRSESLVRSIIEGANEVIFLKDLKGRYVMINTPGAAMIGRTVGETLGKTDAEIFPPETAEAIRNADTQVLQTGKALTYELDVAIGDGMRHFLSTKSPHFGPNGELIGLIGVSLDVTDRRKLEGQLLQTQKMEAIGTLSGGIAHDFNNLLTVIKGYTGLVLNATPDAGTRALIGRIDQAADRAAALTSQLLAYSRRQVLQPRVFKLNTLVLNLDKLLQRLIGEDITLKSVIEPNLGSIKADPGQIEQIIMNLAVNARDAMPRGGGLTIETANVNLDDGYGRTHEGVRPGSYIMLAVSDTGSGIDAGTRSHIFEPFFTTKGVGRGTGLGLSMVYGIVKQSGGSIEVYSEPGHGTTFKIYLPRVEEPVEALPVKSADELSRGTETILLVEDDEQVRELARKILINCGYTVLAAESAAAVLRHCESHAGPIHVLLTDVVMPGMGGRQIAEQVKPRRPGIKVLYMSGYTTNAIVHHGVLDAGTHFLQKPFTPASLAAKIREVLNHTKAPEPRSAAK